MRTSILRSGLASALVVAAGAADTACLDRDVSRESPSQNTTVVLGVTAQAVDKVDLLFLIDNSASMGDKQTYLTNAIPDLVTRLVQPNCLKPDGVTPDGTKSSADGMGTCTIPGDVVEFPPVHNMHIGIVTSSLGTRGGDLCQPNTVGGLDAHEDDRGELINRAGPTETPVADMTSSNFLAWFPPSAPAGDDPGATPTVAMAMELEDDFSDAISGVHQGGCGIESQLEAWYRFLVQPDPYDSIDSSSGSAAWVGVDSTILKQRHDFLRPDSLVAIVDLTDENDSEIDVRSFDQKAYNWMYAQASTFAPPRGTSACATNPGDPLCTSCAYGGDDPNCALGGYTADNDWGFNANLRHVHMKAKYGVDLQFPLSRYVTGLSSPMVPNRSGEYPTNASKQMADSYVGNANCVNPLFAASLPDGTSIDEATLCSLPAGTRRATDVFYAHIGGVPNELLHFVPNDPEASKLTSDDWKKILGNDPDNFDYSGIDPHMIESYAPRPGLPPPSSADDADPISGREWTTDSTPTFVDLEFACTFPLVTPRDCTAPENVDACDCPTSESSTLQGGDLPPLCGGPQAATPAARALSRTQQVAAKAYPTIREIELAKLMGDQGILSSICPVDVADNATMDDPLYGYRPAVAALVDRLKGTLGANCLPQSLMVAKDGSTPCLVLEVLPDPTDTCADEALDPADPDSEAAFRATLTGTIADNPICKVPALTATANPADFDGTGTCKMGGDPGWCYVQSPSAGTCAQAIVLTAKANIAGSQQRLQCIESTGAPTNVAF
jgi:hypothetical protein